MGSQAQDARHEQILQNCRDRVFHIERQINAKENELEQLKKDLSEAKNELKNQEYLDLRRD